MVFMLNYPASTYLTLLMNGGIWTTLGTNTLDYTYKSQAQIK